MLTNREKREKYEAIVQGPGKFEGEQSYSPYFYDLMMNGGGDSTVYDQEMPVEIFIVTKEDRAIFPDELKGVHAVTLYEDGQGFVYSIPATKKELAEYLKIF